MSYAEHRQRVRMTDDEITAMVDEGKSLQVSTIDQGGGPHLATLWYGLLDGRIVAWTPAETVKARHLRANPRAAWLIEAGTEYSELRGVSFSGRIDLTDDQDELRRIGTAIFSRNYPPAEQPDIDEMMAGRRRVGLIFQPAVAAGWDHRKLGRRRPLS